MPITSFVIFFVSLALRIWQIAYPINVDEALWLFRGDAFIRRMLEGDFAGTYLRHHPGVTNMWLTGTGHLLSSGIYSLFPDWLGVNEVPYLHSCFSNYECPISLWIAPRFLQALVTSACMVGIYLLTKKLLGKPTALIATSLLILEPFFLAYQRFITTDALQADFSILSVLLLLLYLRGKANWKYLVGSGICLGLATASKIPALFITPAVIIWLVLIELGVFRASFPRRGWQRQAIDLVLWGLTAIVVIVLIWPTLWVTPGETLQKIYTDLLAESARGDLFFLGEVRTPGVSFYPLILIYRLSPVLQIGVLCGLVTLIIPKLRPKNSAELTALAIIPFVILGILSTSDSKIGRYIVVVIPELAILAAAGYLQILHWLTKIKHKIWQGFSQQRFQKNINLMLLLLILIQSILLIALCPQYVAYYNPLFGGASVGQNLIHIGIGEGLEEAADFLNKSPNSESLKVASWYNLAFAPYFKGKTIGSRPTNPVNLLKTNRVITYINQVQRNLPSKRFIEYFLPQKPLHTISLAGVDYVRVYPGLAPLSEELKKIEHPLSILFGEKVRLIGYDIAKSKIESEDKLSITFYWEFLQSLPSDWRLNLSLESLEKKHVQNAEVDLVNGYIPIAEIPPGTILRDVQQLTIEKDIKPSPHKLKVGWVAPDGKSVINATDDMDRELDSSVVIDEFEI